jgi:bifunctional UDP-N-acetylglucosamine pyrophosphorylase/glucosamine-1-phosphate N-acetyltransferase
VRGGDGTVDRIIEHKDATEAERANRLCNSGVLCADAGELFQLLAKVRNENAKGEYYLTDAVALARAAGSATHVLIGQEGDALGVNSRVELAAAEAAFQRRTRIAMMEAGVTLIDPDTVFFSYDTQIGEDVVIEPNVYFGKGVTIAKSARIKAFCHIEGAEIGEGANVGPSARLRPGTKLGPNVKIGNFVEIKNATFGAKAQASHLTYVLRGRCRHRRARQSRRRHDHLQLRWLRQVSHHDRRRRLHRLRHRARRAGERGQGRLYRSRQTNLEAWADKNRAKKQKPKGKS